MEDDNIADVRDEAVRGVRAVPTPVLLPSHPGRPGQYGWREVPCWPGETGTPGAVDGEGTAPPGGEVDWTGGPPGPVTVPVGGIE